MPAPNAPEPTSYDYAIVRVVPRVERGEFLNVGVIVYCHTRRFLAARVALDTERLRALAPDSDASEIARHLESIPRICIGGTDAGPIGRLAQPERFHWLVAPRSTIVQASPVHCGLCDDPAATLERLYLDLVAAAPP
jgi:hypothetical protein